jgi:hypothetical protein
MNRELILDLMQQRKNFNEKMDKQLLDAMGIPTNPAVRIGLSFDAEGMGKDEQFSHIPSTEPLPTPGIYCLNGEAGPYTFQVEVMEVQGSEIMCIYDIMGESVPFRLPVKVFNKLFVSFDDF